MLILGIETSCDETAAAIVENGTKIISNVVASSAEMHAKTGGVIPENAARRQVESIVPVVSEAKIAEIDAIAVTVGPGLVGSLLIGVETAKTLALLWKKPIIPTNHLVAHIYANWISGEEPEFPALALVVSGGHTDLVLLQNHGNTQLIGGTRDDAAGEAFDKTARLLGLPYPGGPSLSKEAQKYLDRHPDKKLDHFPRPISDEKNFEWSFSGLKTAVQRELARQQINESTIPLFAAETQEAIVDCLVIKTLRAVEKYKPASLLLAGGVAANSRLREKLQEALKQSPTQLFVPLTRLCTDNAASIASCAFFKPKKAPWRDIGADPELTITSQM